MTTKQTAAAATVNVATSVAYVSMSRLTQSLTYGNGLSESNTYNLDSTPTRQRVLEGATNVIDRTLARADNLNLTGITDLISVRPAIGSAATNYGLTGSLCACKRLH